MANEKRLIDANALIHRVCAERDSIEINHACDIGYHNGLNMDVSMAINAPTVDAVEVVHGWWEEWWPGISVIMTGEEMLYRCSCCDAKYADIEGGTNTAPTAAQRWTEKGKTMREKLIELLNDSFEKQYEKRGLLTAPHTAEDLIANGVTVTDNNVGCKWIPVSERLPERDGQYLCNYHFGKHRDMTFTRVLDYYATDAVPHFQHTLGDTTMKVTHWMPLPEPPKGE